MASTPEQKRGSTRFLWELACSLRYVRKGALPARTTSLKDSRDVDLLFIYQHLIFSYLLKYFIVHCAGRENINFHAEAGFQFLLKAAELEISPRFACIDEV